MADSCVHHCLVLRGIISSFYVVLAAILTVVLTTSCCTSCCTSCVLAVVLAAVLTVVLEELNGLEIASVYIVSSLIIVLVICTKSVCVSLSRSSLSYAGLPF